MQSPLSPIQNHVISLLKNAQVLKYSELHPENIPNDLFNYHLQQLVKKELVLKVGGGYSLSPSGVQHVADPYNADDILSGFFKVNVITIVSKVEDGEIYILNQKRMSHPSFGKVGVMGGVVRKGESIEAAATRKLFQETGLTAVFTYVGCERRMLYKDGALFSDILFPITYADTSTGELLQKTEFGENMWVTIDEAIQNDTAEFDSIQSIVKVLELVKKGEIQSSAPFFVETEQRG